MDLLPQDALMLDKAVDPNSSVFKELMFKLMRVPDDGKTLAQRLKKEAEFKFTLPYKGDADVEADISRLLPVKFSDRASFRNGAASLAVSAAELLDLIVLVSGRKRMTATLVVSAESQSLYDAQISAGAVSGLVYYCERSSLVDKCISLSDKLETMILDHTTVNVPVDEVLNLAYRAGVKIVDGVFPYHVAATRGWDAVAGVAKWSYTHTSRHISIGPDDDSSRLIRYDRHDYMKFVDPRLWSGNSRQYLYEIRKCDNGLAVYRATYVGQSVLSSPETMSFKMPLCSSDDMVLVTINKQLASGSFVSRSNNARELRELDMNYAIEVRKELFVTCVNYLIQCDKGTDIVGTAIRYISQHNYVDLMDGVRVIRCPSLSYSDGLCVAMVCALVAFGLRYRLTNESMGVIKKSMSVARMAVDAPFGALGRLAWLFGEYVYSFGDKYIARPVERAKNYFAQTDYIPGVCFDVYIDRYYDVDAHWTQPELPKIKPKDYEYKAVLDHDPFVAFMGDNVDTSAPTVLYEKPKVSVSSQLSAARYEPNFIKDPVSTLMNGYDIAFPGNSVAQLQNVSELRRVRDTNVNTEFYGRIEINKDIAAPERLHEDLPVRTAALPISRTPLLDAIMASAKRNFNPPDMQLQEAVFSYAKTLADRFIENCFVEGYADTIGKSYIDNPITFNVTDYMEWLGNKDQNYRSALQSECPEDLVELQLEKYDTIVKKRIKPKLSVAAQHELSQPQVIVSLSKKDTAPFTSVFRKIFERLDNALRPNIKSAGRLSDAEISEWLSEHAPVLEVLRAIEMDSGKYDKSQGLLARLIEAFVMVALGLDPGVTEIFADSYVGRVSSKVLGLTFVSAYQMKSGAPQTMLGNLIYNFVSAGESIGFHHIKYMIGKGDDNVVWPSEDADPILAVSKMAHLFNLETKLITGSPIHFSSGYILFIDGAGFFVPDVLKMVEILGELGTDMSTLKEQFISFGDRVSSLLAHPRLPEVLQSAVRARYSNDAIPVIDMVDALAALAGDSAYFFFIKSGKYARV